LSLPFAFPAAISLRAVTAAAARACRAVRDSEVFVEFTPEDIEYRMEVYTDYAHRIKQLKDLLLDFEIFGDEDLVEASMRQQDGIIREIRMIYQDKMVPIIEELVQYICENAWVLDRAAGEEEGIELKAEKQEPQQKSPERSREDALDMGSSYLTSIISEMTQNRDD